MKTLHQLLITPITLLILIGCSRKQAQIAPPPPEVIIATVEAKDVPIEREGVATLEGFSSATISAQVQGYLVSRDYKEGSMIKKGDLLFEIDPRPFEAALAQAQGNVATARANQLKSDADVKPGMQLFQERVISAQERDVYINAASVGKANVQALEAAERQAEINLGYTRITAPIDGIVSIASKHVGDLVGPGTGALTTVYEVDPIKAIVNVGEQGFTEILTGHPDSEERDSYLTALAFDLILGNGKAYAYKGKFYAEDSNLDVKTGAIRVEIAFPNPGNVLRPGQFGKVRTVIEREKSALVIPQEAVAELQGSQVVGVVGSDNTIGMRPVKMGERVGSMWQVLAGLKAGEKVVVEGMMKVRPGMPVMIKDWTPSAARLAVANEMQSTKE